MRGIFALLDETFPRIEAWQAILVGYKQKVEECYQSTNTWSMPRPPEALMLFNLRNAIGRKCLLQLKLQKVAFVSEVESERYLTQE